MITWSSYEAQWLGNMREGANKALAKMVAKQQEGLEKPGEIAYRLGWDLSDLAYQDHLRLHLTRLLDGFTQEESPATLELAIESYTAEVLRWQPQHSTNPTSNTIAELEHRVKQYILEQLCSIRAARQEEAAKASVAEAPTADTKKAK
jgi:hypothetical protein